MRMCNANQRNTSVRCIQHETFVFNVIFPYVFHIESYTEKNARCYCGIELCESGNMMRITIQQGLRFNILEYVELRHYFFS